MNHQDWLQYTDIVMARHAFSGVCLAKIFEDRVQQMPQEDYQALLAQLDDPAIVTWCGAHGRTRRLSCRPNAQAGESGVAA